MSMKSTIVRQAALTDLPAITEIYNEAIVNTTATFDTEIKSVESHLPWFCSSGPRHPIVVAEEDGTILGWGALKAYSDRAAYDETAEVALYIRDGYRRQGVGRQIMAHLLEHGKAAGLHTVLSRITRENEASLRLHERFGFELVGTMREVGTKFGRRLDVQMMQLML